MAETLSFYIQEEVNYKLTEGWCSSSQTSCSGYLLCLRVLFYFSKGGGLQVLSTDHYAYRKHFKG